MDERIGVRALEHAADGLAVADVEPLELGLGLVVLGRLEIADHDPLDVLPSGQMID